MSNIHDWTIPGAGGQPIYGSTHEPADRSIGDLVICHGFKGYKDYGLFPRLAEQASIRGLSAHRFNFSHSGMTPDTDTFERPDLFEQDTWGKQIDDLIAVARAIGSGRPGRHTATPAADDRAPGQSLPMVWFGHSRGGVTCLLTAARLADRDAAIGPAGVVAAASPHQADHLNSEQKRALRKAGRLESPSSRTGQVLHIGRAWLDELEADPVSLDPIGATGRLGCPLLIVHGEADPTVPVGSAHTLAAAAGSHARVELIAGASHTFNAPNPLPLDQTPPPETTRLIECVCDFALECCGGQE